jgi:hypothetical protein
VTPVFHRKNTENEIDRSIERFDGCTEYRAYTPEDVQAIKDMVELCRV